MHASAVPSLAKKFSAQIANKPYDASKDVVNMILEAAAGSSAAAPKVKTDDVQSGEPEVIVEKIVELFPMESSQSALIGKQKGLQSFRSFIEKIVKECEHVFPSDATFLESIQDWLPTLAS